MAPELQGTEQTAGDLLEREPELASIESLLRRAHAGGGGALVIEGSGGLGKTALLARARSRGEELGMRVVSARGAELEQTFPWGVVRQFFESFLFTVEPDERDRWLRQSGPLARALGGGDDTPSEEFALLHGLYWLCVKIADERSLLMVLDDAQWADEPSLNFVEFFIRRLDRLPIAMIVATRPPTEHAARAQVSLGLDPAVELMHLAPLSADAVGGWVRRQVHEQAHSRFSQVCHEVTGGNPFLVSELLREITLEGLGGTAETAQRVRSLGPQGVARAVLLRLGRLGGEAQQLAAALAVAAPDTPLPELAQLAGLHPDAAGVAAAALESAEIAVVSRGVRFRHPIMRASVYEDLAGARRSALHAQAAHLARARGANAREIAGHLLHVTPAGDPWVVEELRAAAAEATAAGDFASAERLLGRALKEQVSQPLTRAEVLAELGRAEARTGNPAGIQHLQDAIDSVEDPVEAAAMAVELASILKFSLQPERAAAVLIEAAGRLDGRDAEASRRLSAELLGTRFLTAATTSIVQEQLQDLSTPKGEPRDLLDAFMLAAAAFDTVAELGTAAGAIELGRRALSGNVIPVNPVLGGQALVIATVALIWAEDLEHVFSLYTAALQEGRDQGSPLVAGNAAAMRAMCGYRAGRLLDAEADAALALDLAAEVPAIQTLLAPATAYAVLSGLERGVAHETLSAQAFDERLELGRDTLPFTQLIWARGELLLAQDMPERALAEFRACDRREPGYGGLNPSMVPWREGAAQALARLGRVDEARELAADAVARAERFAAARARGVALRAQGLISGGEERLALLACAVQTLERSPGRLELARARTDLGAALRAAGERTEAQTVLALALQEAEVLGAVRIAQRARDELSAAGVRPQRSRSAGRDGLTPSERRVAEFAADGKTNREIAQALFVTEKTVETHLGHVYDKLGVRSRRKLPAALGLSGAV